MADIKINDLAAYTDPVSTDVLPIVDVGNDLTKKVSIADLLENAGTGSAAAPSFSFDGDNNTGIYRPGADQVALTAGGTQALLAESTGITIPGNLTVSGTTTTVDTVNLTVKDKNIELGVVSTPSNTTADGGGITLKGATDKTINWVNSTGAWTFNQPTNFNDHVRIDSSGKVGIGISSPIYTLHLQNNSGPTLSIDRDSNLSNNDFIGGLRFGNNDSSASPPHGTGIKVTADGTFGAAKVHFLSGNRGAWESDLYALTIDGSGNVGIGTTGPSYELVVKGAAASTLQILSSGTTNLSRLFFGDDTNTARGFINYDHSDDSMRFGANSAERARIDSSGRLLVGTSSVLSTDSGHIIQASDAVGAKLSLGRDDSSVSSGNAIGKIMFSGNAGGTYQPVAEIACDADGDHANNDKPGRLVFSTAADGASSPTERLRIDSSGNVGIGTSSPQSKLSVGNGASTDSGLSITFTGDNSTLAKFFANTATGEVTIGGVASNYFPTFYSSGSERMRIDSSGRLLVGTSTGYGVASSALARFQVGSTAADIHASLTDWSNVNQGGVLAFGAARGGALGNYTIVQNGDNLGSIRFAGADGTDLQSLGAAIAAQVDGTPGANDMPTRLVFSTTADGASSPTERLRINSAGRFFFNESTSDLGHKYILSGNQSADVAAFQYNGNSGTYLAISTGAPNGNVEIKADARSGSFPPLVFKTGANERLRIDSSGNVGVGKSSNLFYRLTFAEGAGDSSRIGWVSGSGNRKASIDCGNTAALVFRTDVSDAERMRIDSSGNVGIGTSSPGGYKLHVAGNVLIGQANSLLFGSSSGPAPKITNSGQQNSLSFFTNGSESARIDSSGNVGIGTTSPGEELQIGAITSASSTSPVTLSLGGQYTPQGSISLLNLKLKVYDSGTDSAGLTAGQEGLSYVAGKNQQHIWYRADGAGTLSESFRSDTSGRLLVGTSSWTGGALAAFAGNSSVATGNGVVHISRGRSAIGMSSGDALGGLYFSDNAGNTFGEIVGLIDATPGANDYPGRLVFSTTADGASSPTERMRINRSGSLRVPQIYAETTASGVNVYVHSNGTLQRSTSSAKYKTDIETLEISYSDALLNCRPVWYRSTCEADNADFGWWGFIAEEVAEIDPRLVHWKTTEITYDEKGSAVETPCDPEPEGIAYDRFVPHLLNLIKRQQTAIETLETKVAALEAAS